MKFQKQLCFIVLFLPIFVSAQTEGTKEGIKWTTGLSWEDVKAKAKKENKYIFVDCFTTWCGPCKMMDKEVFADDSVGVFFNKNFISVKVQMDKTQNDNKEIRAWYTDAKIIEKEFEVKAFPTLLFFNSNMTLVDKHIGAPSDIKDFLISAATALKPGMVYIDVKKPYQVLISKYRHGESVSKDSMPDMIKIAYEEKDTIYKKMVSEYVEYVSGFSKKDRYTRKGIIRLASREHLYMHPSIASYFYRDAKYINKVMGSRYFAAKVLDKFVLKNFITPFLVEKNKNKTANMTGMYMNTDNPEYSDEIDWKELENKLRKQFNKKYTEWALINAKIEWYRRNSDEKMMSRYVLKKFEKSPPDSIAVVDNYFLINDCAWDIFLHVTNRDTINRAMKLAEKLVNQLPKFSELADTYAALLYKAGKKERAILWENKALTLSNGKNEIYRNTLEQMKRDEPIHLSEGSIWDGFDTLNWEGVKFRRNFFIKNSNGHSLAQAEIINKRVGNKIPVWDNGQGIIEVQMGDVIVISAPGYETKELLIEKSASPITVILSSLNKSF